VDIILTCGEVIHEVRAKLSVSEHLFEVRAFEIAVLFFFYDYFNIQHMNIQVIQHAKHSFFLKSSIL